MSQDTPTSEPVLFERITPSWLPDLLLSPMMTYSAVRNPSSTLRATWTKVQAAMACATPSQALSTLFWDFQLTGSLFAMDSKLSQKEKIEYIELVANIIIGLLEMWNHYFISRSSNEIEIIYNFVKNLLCHPLETDLWNSVATASPIFLNNYWLFLLETGKYKEWFQVLGEAAEHSRSTFRKWQYYFDAVYSTLNHLDAYLRVHGVQNLDRDIFQTLQARSRELITFAEDMWNIYYNQANRTDSARSSSQQGIQYRESFERWQKCQNQAKLIWLYVHFLWVRNGHIACDDIAREVAAFEILKRQYIASLQDTPLHSPIDWVDYRRTFDQGDGNLIAQIELSIHEIWRTDWFVDQHPSMQKYVQQCFWEIWLPVVSADEWTILWQVAVRWLEWISLNMRGLSWLYLPDWDTSSSGRITDSRDKYFYAIASEIIRQFPVWSKMRIIIERFLNWESAFSKGIAKVDLDSVRISVKVSWWNSAWEDLEEVLLRNRENLIKDTYTSLFGIRQWRLVLESDHESIISSNTKYDHWSADSTTSWNARFAQIAWPHDTIFLIELIWREDALPTEIVHIVADAWSQKWIHGLLKEPVKDAEIISLRMKNYLLGLENAVLKAELANDPLEKVRGLIEALNNSLLPYHKLQNIPWDEALRIANSTNNFLMNIVSELLRNSDKPQWNIVQLRYISDLVSSSIVGLWKIFTDDKISPATVSSPAYQKVTDALMKLGVALAQIQELHHATRND